MSFAPELPEQPEQPPLPLVEELVFVGFNSQVLALDRNYGHQVWQWKAPEGRGFVAVLLDGDRIIASVQGYTYCLDPATGQTLWSNPLKGLGVGTTCLASVRGRTTNLDYALSAEQEAQQQQAAAANAGT